MAQINRFFFLLFLFLATAALAAEAPKKTHRFPTRNAPSP